jgi:hypothetical protein
VSDAGSRLRRILPWLVLATATLVVATLVVIARVPSLSAAALTTALGRLVEVDAIDLRLGLMLHVDVRGLRVHQDMTPDSPVMLEAPRAVGRQAWPRVLAGQIVPLDWEIEAPIARVATGPGASSLALSLDALDDVPLVALRVSEGTVEIDAQERGTLMLQKVSVDARRRALVTSLSGSTSAVVVARGKPLVDLETTWEADDASLEVDARFRNANLAALAMLATGEPVPLAGSATGSAKLRWSTGALDADIDTKVDELSALVPGTQSRVSPSMTQIAVTLGVRSDEVTLRARPIALDDIQVTGTLAFERSGERRVRADLTLAPFRLGPAEAPESAAPRITPLTLLALSSPTARALAAQAEAGRVEDISVALDLPYAELGTALTFARPLGPDELRIDARLADARLRARPEYPPLERVSGGVVLHGDRLAIRSLRMSREGHALPTVSFELQGLAHFLTLDPDERALPDGPGVKIPGLGPAFAALGGRDEPDTLGETNEGPREAVMHVHDLKLEYPALVFRMRGMNGSLRFRPDRMLVDDATGVVAGGNASLAMDWRFEANTIDARLIYLADRPPAPRDTMQKRAWLAGTFEMETARLGAWPVTDLRGELASDSGEVTLRDVTARMAGGELRADGTVDLRSDGHAPIDFAIDLRGADAAETLRGLLPDTESVTGRAAVSGRIRGRLEPGETFMRRARASLRVSLEDGALAELPAGVQLARLPSLQGVSGLFGRALPYESVAGRLELADGTLECRDFSLLGPELRMLLGGTIDIASPEHDTDLVIVLLFLQTLDGVIERIPLFGDLILGEKGSLVTASFRLRGPFDAPSVSLIPLSRLQDAAGWTGGWLRRLGAWVPGLGTGEPPEDGEGDGGDESGTRPHLPPDTTPDEPSPPPPGATPPRAPSTPHENDRAEP